MIALTIILAVFLSLFSTAVMSYIAMALPIGPWIEATLVLLAIIIVKGVLQISNTYANRAIALAVAAGGIGGIAATACAFSLPTLYFLDPALFNSWMANPGYFALIVGALVMAAGGIGFIVARGTQEQLIEKEQLPFAIGTMVEKMIFAQEQAGNSLQLLAGSITSLTLAIAQTSVVGFFKHSYNLLSSRSLLFFKIPGIAANLTIVPMIVSIGYIAGALVTKPLAWGIGAKILLLEPLHTYFFATLSSVDFPLAFCSGMVLQGTIASLKELPKFLKWAYSACSLTTPTSSCKPYAKAFKNQLVPIIVVALCTISLLTHLKFSPLAQLYIIIGTALSAYQLCSIAGKIGIAPVGRFATFVMVPGLLLFGINPVHATVIAAFVEIAGGIGADVLFGRKMAQLANIPQKSIEIFQWLGLVLSAASMGIIFWLLIKHFGLGSSQLLAYKAQARSLLLNAHTFNYTVLGLGMLFGFVLQKFKINPTFVLGGILMQVEYSLWLIVGGLISLYTPNADRYTPFWSGVFAATSLWMIIKTVL